VTWLAIALCLALSFIFSGTEAGLLSLNRVRLRHLARRKDPAAVRLARLLENPTRLFVTVLCGTSLLNITAVVLFTQKTVAFFAEWGYFVALLIAVPVLLLLVEILPKSIFRRFPYRALASIALLLEAASLLLTPLLWCGTLVARKTFGLRKPRELFVAREDLKYVTSEIERLGMLSSIERQMIHNAVDFRSVRVRDVMVPMEQVVAVKPETPLEEVVRLFRETKYDRFPVVDSHGRMVGVVNALDLLVDRRPEAVARQYLRRVLNVRPDEPAPLVIRRLRASPQNLGTVINETGLPIGIVSVEDLLNPLIQIRSSADQWA
jgi:CBS domain containing-hemolysin-like protein